MLLKLVVFLTCQYFVMCRLDVNRTLAAVSVKTDSKCSGKCVTKCCPQGMVFAKVKNANGDAKRGCATWEDGVFQSKQIIHDRTEPKDYVYLPETFKMLYGKPCKSMYISNHPFYLQEVS